MPPLDCRRITATRRRVSCGSPRRWVSRETSRRGTGSACRHPTAGSSQPSPDSCTARPPPGHHGSRLQTAAPDTRRGGRALGAAEPAVPVRDEGASRFQGEWITCRCVGALGWMFHVKHPPISTAQHPLWRVDDLWGWMASFPHHPDEGSRVEHTDRQPGRPDRGARTRLPPAHRLTDDATRLAGDGHRFT